jgi:predicted amidohydrolase
VIDINTQTGAVVAVMRAGDLTDLPPTLEFEMSHPAFADRDHAITLNKALPDAEGNPQWAGHFVTVPNGRYYAVLKSTEWRLSAEWRGDATLTLRPDNNDGS